jgi:DNA-binding phage protein
MAERNAPKVDGTTRDVFSKNVRHLMDERYSTSQNKPMSLAKDAGISLSSVQRALSGETASNLDTLEAIAFALDVAPAELLSIRRLKGPSSNC